MEEGVKDLRAEWQEWWSMTEKFMETEQEEKEGKGRDGMKKKLKGKCRNMNILG